MYEETRPLVPEKENDLSLEILLKLSELYHDAKEGKKSLDIPVCRRRVLVAKRVLRMLAQTALFILLGLGFFELPHWCLENERCRRPEYPTFLDGELFLERHTSVYALELPCLLILTMYSIVEFLNYGMKQLIYGSRELLMPMWVKNCALIIYYLDLFFDLRVRNYCRVIFLVTNFHTVWSMIIIILRILPDAIDAATLFIFYILFSFWLASITFDKGPEHASKYMRDFPATLWTLLILLSNNDFPSAMMPAYDVNRLTILFFAVYLIIGIFVLLNLVFAVLYTSFLKRHQIYLERKAQNTKQAFRKAFNLLASSSSGQENACQQKEYVSFGRVVNFLSYEFRQQVQQLEKPLQIHLASILTEITQQTNQNSVNFNQFVQIMQKVNDCLLQARRKTEVQRIWPSMYYSLPFRQLSGFVEKRLDKIVHVVLILNFIVYVTSTNLLHCPVGKKPNACATFRMDLGFTAFYFMELLLKSVVLGAYRYFSTLSNKFDFGVTLISCFASILVLITPDALKLLKLSIVLRQLRLIRLVQYTTRFQLVVNTTKSVSSTMWTLALIFFAYFYFAGTLGVNLFGGYICTSFSLVAPHNSIAYSPTNSTNTTALETCRHHADWDPDNDDYAASGYYAGRRDLAGAFVVIFEIMLGNDYNILADGFVKATGSSWARFFFTFNYACLVVVLTNVVIAVIVKTYLEQWQQVHFLDDDIASSCDSDDKKNMNQREKEEESSISASADSYYQSYHPA